MRLLQTVLADIGPSRLTQLALVTSVFGVGEVGRVLQAQQDYLVRDLPPRGSGNPHLRNRTLLPGFLSSTPTLHRLAPATD